MKKFSRMILQGVLCAMILFLTACGAKKSSDFMPETAVEEKSMDVESTESTGAIDYDGAGESEQSSILQDAAKDSNNSSQKLVKRVFMAVETKEFENLTSTLTAQIDELGGYVENSEVNSLSYQRPESTRFCSMVVRIPNTKLSGFVKSVQTSGNVVRQTESQENVTLQYVDIKSHKKALVIEQKRLLALLKKAEKLSYIIKLEDRLSDVRYQIESYESQLRAFDNLVDYSTITLEISEVEHVTKVNDKTMGERMNTGFNNSLHNIKIALQNFSVWFVSNILYLVMWAIVLSTAFIAAYRIRRKRKASALSVLNNNISSDEGDVVPPTIQKEDQNN